MAYVAVSGGEEAIAASIAPVSYTHLDVYKRQLWNSSNTKWQMKSACL